MKPLNSDAIECRRARSPPLVTIFSSARRDKERIDRALPLRSPRAAGALPHRSAYYYLLYYGRCTGLASPCNGRVRPHIVFLFCRSSAITPRSRNGVHRLCTGLWV
ncbi:unnamed protein product, partial [Iphiclides podalirius]